MNKHLVCPLMLMIGLLFLAACSPDPCASGENLPSCSARKAEVNATVMAINADAAARERQAFMQATQDAIALRAQATQGAINSQATAVAVQMAATHVARDRFRQKARGRRSSWIHCATRS